MLGARFIRLALAMTLLALVMPAAAASDSEPTGLRPWISLRFPGTTWVTTERLAEWTVSGEEPAPLLLDARTSSEFAVSRIRGAVRVDPEAQEFDLGSHPRERRIVVYCSVGYRSAAIARRLAAAGYERVYNLEGGIFQWANEGRAVFRDGARIREVDPFDRSWGRYLKSELHPER